LYLNWDDLNKDVFVIDIEADSLTPTVLWCLCWRNVKTGEIGEATTLDEIKEFFRTHHGIYVGHNIIKFDGPVLNRLAGTSIDARNCIDTLILSQLYSPSLSGGHSLGAWGERLKKPKIEFEDFSRLTVEMVEYCHQDVAITAELFVKLIKVLRKIEFSEGSIWLQHHLTELLDSQHNNGFYFNVEEAICLYTELRRKETELEEQIHVAFPPTRVLVRTGKTHTAKGELSAIYRKDRERFVIREDKSGGSYEAYEDVPFSVGSPKQRYEKLIELGWEPKEFTEKGTPTPFIKGKLAPSLETFLEDHDIPEVKLIAKWMSINGRANMINTWLDNYNDRTHCIHGSLFVADTLRLRHQRPNTANIPAVRVHEVKDPITKSVLEKHVLYGEDGFYTYEARNLWTARPGRVLVGTDAAGLELRMLAHYLASPDFTDQVVNGDPHQYNADLVGISRPQAKTLIYAVLYGAAAPKVAKTLDVSVKEAAHIRNLFLERLGVGRLIEECQAEQRDGRIGLVDGSKIICPSPHAALNYKLQGGGARVMALSSVLADRVVKKNNWDVLKVGDIHDEDQSDCALDVADDFGNARVQSIRDAGTYLKLNIPLDAEYKKGLTWALTH
jgi:DNA polymerase-1